MEMFAVFLERKKWEKEVILSPGKLSGLFVSHLLQEHFNT